MGEEVSKLASIIIGRVILGGMGLALRWDYYQLKRRNLCIDDYENKVFAFSVLLVFFIVLYFWLLILWIV